MSNDDDVPQLSADTFNALQEFYKEQEERENRLKLQVSSDNSAANDVFDENWQLSQFWYDDKTIDTLIDIALKTVSPDGKVALVSCPTLYKKMKERSNLKHEITLFEYDQRFSIFGNDFVPYDYRVPLDIPREKCSYYDLVIADPPFLSEECLTKTAVTLKFLTKEKIIVCTGAIMADLIQRLLNLERTAFEPKHKNNLANEFWCYSNFNLDELL